LPEPEGPSIVSTGMVFADSEAGIGAVQSRDAQF
jgi:hypothetical protein